MIPAHKSNTAGQIVNTEEMDKMAYKTRPKTLGDVIDNVVLHEQQLNKKKLTFEEWLQKHDNRNFQWWRTEDMIACWKAAQENKMFTSNINNDIGDGL